MGKRRARKNFRFAKKGRLNAAPNFVKCAAFLVPRERGRRQEVGFARGGPALWQRMHAQASIGDILHLHILFLTLDRTRGWSNDCVDTHVVD